MKLNSKTSYAEFWGPPLLPSCEHAMQSSLQIKISGLGAINIFLQYWFRIPQSCQMSIRM
jgi:hypothetical protein